MGKVPKQSRFKKPKLCSIFEKHEEELNKLIAKLVNTPDAQLKVMWSWGIV